MNITHTKYALNSNKIKICFERNMDRIYKYMQHKNFNFGSIGHKTNFYPTVQLLLLKEKNA